MDYYLDRQGYNYYHFVCGHGIMLDPWSCPLDPAFADIFRAVTDIFIESPCESCQTLDMAKE